MGRSRTRERLKPIRHTKTGNPHNSKPRKEPKMSGGIKKWVVILQVAVMALGAIAQEKPEVYVQLGHSGTVRSVSFSPDGKLLASGSHDKTVKLWDVATGREIRTLEGHSGGVISVSFSPDGKLLASGSEDGTTRLWNAQTGKEVAMFVSFTDGEWVAITPEGYYDASPNGDKYLNVRIGNNVYGIENYRKTYFRPDMVKLAIKG